MLASKNPPKTIDEYIALYPEEVQKLLQKLRETIHETAPEATEAMAYGIPTFKLNGNLVHFGGFKNHIGFFPGAEGIEVFSKELTGYVQSKGTVQFPLDKPIPYDIVKKIVKFRVSQQLEKKK